MATGRITERCAVEQLEAGMVVLLDPSNPNSRAMLIRAHKNYVLEGVDLVLEGREGKVQTRLPWGCTVMVVL